MMDKFKRRFTFRRKADEGEVTRTQGALSQLTQDTTLSSEPSTSERSINSNNHFINQQLTSSSLDPTPRHGTLRSPLRSESSIRGSEPSGRDPLGLKVVYRPKAERKVDVVFMHGLGGTSRATWSHNRNPDRFWPSKFLRFEPDINEARILTFGYNANFGPGSGSSRMAVLDFAKDLLYDLKYAQDESVQGLEELHMGERPIIFVVHSMGGLVVKEAYMQGQHDPAYESIISAVSAIIFLSTPHRGTNLAKTLNRILRVSFAASPTQFISELAAGSQTLRKLNEQFRHIAPKLDIVSFYETRPTPLAGLKQPRIMVLDKDSSVLGYPGEISKPLDADHHGVCKFASPFDPGYVAVRNVLKSLIGKAELRGLNQAPTKLAITNYAEYLSLSEPPDADYNFFRDRWTPGTCSWILNNETFSGWAGDAGPKPRVLWIHGNAASGKSVLSSSLINHFIESGNSCHYFFIRFMSQEKRGMSMLLRSLAFQLANSTPAYAERIRQLEAAGTDLKTTDHRNLWQWFFKQTLLQMGFLNRPLYIVIDGIDEADQPASVIRVLTDLHATSLPIRLLMVSRTTHEISMAFQRMARQMRTENIRIDGNPADFRAYIDHEMDLGGDAEYGDQVTTQLLDRARGNFLWIHLAVQKINSCHTKPDVQKALTELPSGMEALYDRMALSVEAASKAGNGNLGQTILGWATCAMKPLTDVELEDALGHECGLLDVHRTITELCGGFVTVDHEARVGLVHETAKEYLTRGAEKGQSLTIDVKSTNDMLLQRCIARLTDPTLRAQISRARPPPLLGYATTGWPHHLALSSALTDLELLETVTSFLKGPHVLTWIYAAAKSKELGALVVASHVLSDLSARLRKRIRDGDSVAGPQQAAIIEGWATDLIKIVGKFGSNLLSHPDSIYSLIPPFCPADSMIYKQFGHKESSGLNVSEHTSSTWDDCLVHFPLAPGTVTSLVVTAGNRIALLSATRDTSQIVVYSSSTFEEQRRIAHPERVMDIQASSTGALIITYGYVTTRVWDVSTGDCLKVINNPAEQPWPHTMILAEKQNAIVLFNEDGRIRTCSLGDGSTGWTVDSRIREKSSRGMFFNPPICSALSPDGNKVAFGRHCDPLVVWELEPPMLLGECYRRFEAWDKTIKETELEDVKHVAWHPVNGDLFGLTQIGTLFRWNPHERYVSDIVQAHGRCLAVNQDGSLVATGDGLGTIRIFTTANFSMLYQSWAQEAVEHLSFSADSRQLYDTRAFHGNVWEPNILVRLADSPSYKSAAPSEKESLVKALRFSHHHIDTVTSLAGQSSGPLYCYGTESAGAILCEAGRGKVCELPKLTSCGSIQHVAWSADGTLVALADLYSRVAMNTVTWSGDGQRDWCASQEFEVVIPREHGNAISQLIFHHTGTKLFVATPVKVLSLDVKSQAVTEFMLEMGSADTLQMKWACHPTSPDTLLGFGATKVHILDCNNLRQTGAYTYFPLRMQRPSTNAGTFSAYGGGSQLDTEKLGRLITSTGSREIMLEISAATPSGHFQSEYLLFDIANLWLGEACPEDGDRTLPYTTLSAGIASRTQEPLTILSRRRLVFLDVNHWICTWTLPFSAESGKDPAIEQYYFLPGDWVTISATRLCTVTPDGTLLCPHNGAVVSVQTAKLR